MFEALGYEVIKLKRESIEDLTLEGLKKGEYRPSYYSWSKTTY